MRIDEIVDNAKYQKESAVDRRARGAPHLYSALDTIF